jgi:hypothetical protein
MKIIIINYYILLTVYFKQTLSIIVNQTLLFAKYGYNKDSVIVDLSEKSIDIIDINTFQGLKSLELLFLHENKLQRLETGLFNSLNNLREIWLESNNIVSVDRTIFVGLNKLEKVCFNNNPIGLMFPINIIPLCETNPYCTIKINEKCIHTLPISIQNINIFILFKIIFFKFIKNIELQQLVIQ